MSLTRAGGLGDVMGALPKALARRGHRVMVVAPRYRNYEEGWETGVRVQLGVGGATVEVCCPPPHQILLSTGIFLSLFVRYLVSCFQEGLADCKDANNVAAAWLFSDTAASLSLKHATHDYSTLHSTEAANLPWP